MHHFVSLCSSTDLGLSLFSISSELVVDHLGKGVATVLQPYLGHLVIWLGQHLHQPGQLDLLHNKYQATPDCLS